LYLLEDSGFKQNIDAILHKVVWKKLTSKTGPILSEPSFDNKVLCLLAFIGRDRVSVQNSNKYKSTKCILCWWNLVNLISLVLISSIGRFSLNELRKWIDELEPMNWSISLHLTHWDENEYICLWSWLVEYFDDFLWIFWIICRCSWWTQKSFPSPHSEMGERGK
jgi:hypothetical protein